MLDTFLIVWFIVVAEIGEHLLCSAAFVLSVVAICLALRRRHVDKPNPAPARPTSRARGTE